MVQYSIAGQVYQARPLPCGLYIVATPIGNLADITIRALETLAAADCIACEDTRISARLLQRYVIDRKLIAYHEHNARRAGAEILKRIGQGQSVALISDAGTPIISDPGQRLVRDARQAGLAVWPIPGPSAAIAALSASGLPADRFHFEGFLPSKAGARRDRLRSMAAMADTLVFYESPSRLAASLADIAAELGNLRSLCVFREMTKLHEEAVAGTAGELADRFADKKVKGEIVILAAPDETGEKTDIDALLGELLEKMNVSRAAAEAAALTGLPKRDLYRQALLLSRSREGSQG